MAGLSNIFGSDDSSSSNDSNAAFDAVADASNTVGLNVDSAQDSYSRDEDGNVSSNSNDTNLGLDSDTDGLLGAVSDLTSSNDETTS